MSLEHFGKSIHKDFWVFLQGFSESDPHSTVKQGSVSQSGENGKGSQASGWHPWAQGAGVCAGFWDGKMTDILSSSSWGTSRDIIHEQKAPKSLRFSPGTSGRHPPGQPRSQEFHSAKKRRLSLLCPPSNYSWLSGCGKGEGRCLGE